MSEIEDDRVSLTVTSPPYWNAIDYDIHSDNSEQNYRTRNYSKGFSDYQDYLDWLEGIFQEIYRVTKPGGFCAVVIGTVLLDGKHYPVPFDLVSRLSHRDWLFHQDFIWHKCTAGVKRAGVFIQKPFPGYYYPNIMNEYILVFNKPGQKIYLDRSPEEKSRATHMVDSLFTMETANNIWHIAPVPPSTIDHPAPFPEEIPYRLITLYSYPEEIILDPFAGSGQTLKVAKALGRKYYGFENIPGYVELAQKRITEPLAIRPQQLIAVFDKVKPGEETGKREKNHL
ncbi:MAG: site-specific DNA-methyltransferase [Chloroflexota bacterium]|nr:MAG: site-specific DNA-methyltransferase [Chloroflexota bacterium]UCF28575.1 MAG: site-specific DNA-methyltransferase [Chloroflexota bacterium]